MIWVEAEIDTPRACDSVAALTRQKGNAQDIGRDQKTKRNFYFYDHRRPQRN